MVAWKKLILIGLLILTPISAFAGMELPQTLQDILAETRASYNRQERPIVIFDIDGTLFDNRPRILKILHEYADTELREVRPKLAKKIKELTINQVRYHITDTLTHIGVTEPAVVTNAAVFWSERFFSDEYLQYDVPTPGVVEYVRTLYSNGARIVYLSGRDAPRQLIGTVKSLRDHGLPIGIQSSELIMKPSAQTQDAMFKQRITTYLRHYGKVVAAFDNEPMNINVYRRAFGQASCVWFGANHRPNSPPILPNITSLASFEKVMVAEPEPAPAPIPTPPPAAAPAPVVTPSEQDPASEPTPVAITEETVEPSQDPTP